jgi:Carboxypeptidase regulatory-like domain
MKPDIGSNRTRGRLLVFATLLALRSWAATTAGTIQGSVVDDTGKPVAGARVLISLALTAAARPFPPPPVVTGPLVATVTADSRGAFSAGSLSPGQYVACAEVTSPGLLDPCHWVASVPTFVVATGNATAGVNIVMARGAVVPVHIDDPLALLKPVAGPIDFDLQIHAITNKGHHYNAPVQTSGPLSREYAITLPFGSSVRFQVLSSRFTINDQSGKSVPPLGTDVTVPTAASPSTIVYVVAGKK